VTRVLVTGVGGPAGVAVLRSLLRRPDVELFAGDMDGWASGLYLVPADRRRILEPGLSPTFVDGIRSLCAQDRIDVVISTVDVELPPLAACRDDLAGAVLAAPSLATLDVTLDKWELAQRCAPLLRVPVTRLLNEDGISLNWTFPVIVKPRRGAGSRGVRLVPDRAALEAIGPDESLIIQENLPGDEYSVDVLSAGDGTVVAAVPRTRTRVDSGVSIAGRTVHDDGLESTAAAVARAIGLRGVANVQLRRDTEGVPALLEVNPRFPGALPLTIAAGVDMPSLVLDLALGVHIPPRIEFADLANVRFLEDVFVDPSEILQSDHAAHQDEPGNE
jgi:carbamoyl-phosphate synthase large subunit